MRKSSKLMAAGACLVLAATALGGCGNAGGPRATTHGANSLMSVYGCEPQNPLIPTDTNESCGGNPIDLLFAKLVTFDSTGKPLNEAAQSIVASNGNKTFTITLKSGWQFSDGSPMTASSFTKAWSYGANVSNAQMNSSFFSGIVGYDDVQKKGVDKQAQLSGLKILNDLTFQVDLSSPSSTFPIEIGYTAFAPLPESFFKDPKAFGNHPIGQGPYKFASWTHNGSIKLVKNDLYRGVLPVRNAGITFKMYTDPEPAYSDLQSGNLDAMEQIPASATRTFKQDSSIQPYSKPGSVAQSFAFPAKLRHFELGTEEGTLRRRAVSMAINRQQICEKILGGTGTAAVDFTAPPIPGYSTRLKGNHVLTYDKQAARRLWAQANRISPWTSRDKLTFAYNTDGGGKALWDAVANQVHNVLGIKVESYAIATFSELRAEITSRQLRSASRCAWQADYPSAESYLSQLFASAAADGKGSNDADYKNPAFDALLEKAAQEDSVTVADKDYQAAEELLLQDLPNVPLYYSNASGGAALGVKGFLMNWKNQLVYTDLSK